MICPLCNAEISSPCDPKECGYYDRYVDEDSSEEDHE